MTRSRPRRLLSLLRVLVLALFALGVALQPVFAAAGEMHELVHDPSGAHEHDRHADKADVEPAVAGDQDQGGARTLHLLLHLAHCCGAAAALLPVVKPLPTMPAAGRLAIANTPISLQTHLASPFKPPIFA